MGNKASKRGEDIRIEFPSRGATYHEQKYGVYKYDTFPRGSVLAGQTRRVFLDQFDSEEEAKQKYPGAPVCGPGYSPPYLGHLPDDGDY
jgi:hypothetical protein